MAEGSSYAGRVQIQQQLYERFCRLCRESLSSDKYNLYRAWSLTQAATLLLNITGEELSLEAESVTKFGSDYDCIPKRHVTV